MPRCKAASEKFHESAEVDFSVAARAIVLQMKQCLSKKAEPKQRDVLDRMRPDEVEAIALSVAAAFMTKKMGLLELSQFAKRELAMVAIRGSVPKFRVGLLSSPKGIGPAEYFIRYYCDLFRTFGLPANAINTIDPNLHFHLKRCNEFPRVTESLAREMAPAELA
jgi:hypothetical protein